MVKLHICTDREYRYNNRCNNKTFTNLKKTILKQKYEVDETRKSYRDIYQIYNTYMTKFGNLRSAYDFLYDNYTKLYTSHDDLKYDYNISTQENEDLKQKYDSLEKKYNELLDEFVDKAIESSDSPCSHIENRTYTGPSF